MEDKSVFIKDQDGNKISGEVIFTFEANGDDFVLYSIENEDKAYAGKIDEEGNLVQIEDDEWKLVEKVYNQYLEDQEGETNVN